MVKFVVLVKLREGVDPDKFWKFWEEVYAPPHMSPGLIKYCINRVTKVMEGEATHWGMAEQWFESEEALHAMIAEFQKIYDAINTAGLSELRSELFPPKFRPLIEEMKRHPDGGFMNWTTDRMVVLMEESIIVEDGALVNR